MVYLIFGDAFTFPEGDASTNRVYSYANGFIENGLDVAIICFRNDDLTNYTGEVDLIRYYHPYRWSQERTNLFSRRWHSILKYYRTITIIRDIVASQELAAIHCYTKSLFIQKYAFLLSILFKSTLILERSEHPLKMYKNKVSKKILGWYRVLIEIRLCSYIFCISDYLMEFYKSNGANIKKLFKVPSTVDFRRFVQTYPSPVSYKYICYCGSLTKQKDGVDILIMSFARIAFRFPDINLLLIGKADTHEDEIFFKKIVSDYKLEDRVFFIGKLPRSEIPAYLCNAEILALARPRSMVADAGFPSKLTEYLATGKPVVVTKVGEIPAFLTDGINAFLTDPDSPEAFSDRLSYVLENYSYAKKAADKGKELTKTIFNYNYQTKRILDFLSLR